MSGSLRQDALLQLFNNQDAQIGALERHSVREVRPKQVFETRDALYVDSERLLTKTLREVAWNDK